MDTKVLYEVVEKAKKYDELVKLYKDDKLYCSFCGKPQEQVRKLIQSQSVLICDECVELCSQILTEEFKKDDENIREGGN